MPRRLRIDFAGAIHHVTSRGVRKRDIFLTPGNRIHWLAIVGEACEDFGLSCLAYCQMDNHYHMVIECKTGCLAQAMQRINGHYGQYFNKCHDMTGHLFQGRYHAELIDRDAYLLEVIRYVLLNPVRAGLVREPADWVWSSCGATLGLAPPLPWLDTERVRRLFGATGQAGAMELERFLRVGLPGARPIGWPRPDPTP